MLIADLHIHSKYSRATSKECDAPHLDLWARRKGIQLLGTGDFTHPAWRGELRDQLVPAGDGLYMLREDLRLPDLVGCPPPRFVVSGEISSIYKKNGRVRKIHNVILLPGLEEADTLSHKLEAIGNVHSDGRPILGLDSRDLLEITLETCPEAVFIPAHIWTPHFSLFGAFSGFDRMEECFEDLTPYIHAVETGLSSDPPMNWRVSALDAYTLVSHSDAHSPANLGREADLLDIELSYAALSRAIQTGEGFAGTLEFFPEEGKYHLDGHRACRLRLTPAETAGLDGKCPVCGKKITIGVQNRVEQLADRPEGFQPAKRPPYESLAPLSEVIAASTGASSASVKTKRMYLAMLHALGPEFYILRQAPLDAIEREAGACVREGIRRLREGQVERNAGYDGEYGTITLLDPSEIEMINGQVSLFGATRTVKKPGGAVKRAAGTAKASAKKKSRETPRPSVVDTLNAEQRRAVCSRAAATAVIAGPGTGKTKTLVARAAFLIEECGADPASITAVTFTNQAAEEMRARLGQRLGGNAAARSMNIGTFHSICLRLLGDVTLISEADALDIAAGVMESQGLKGDARSFLRAVSKVKNGMDWEEAGVKRAAFQEYDAILKAAGVLDFDDLLISALEKGAPDPERFAHLLVDEFQDINGLQYRLIRAWNAAGKSLFVIGDPDQSIYGFRGAEGRCFEQLQGEMPDLSEIRLTENYRSTPDILGCALHMMARAPGPERILNAHCPSGSPVRLLTADSDFSEAVFIAKEIGRMAGGVDMLEAQDAAQRTVIRSFSDIAVLCRTHRQAELIERCLRHDSIPCIVTGREDYLTHDAVRGALGFFRFLLDPGDMVSLRACLRLVWRCPPGLIERAEAFCRSEKRDPAALREAFGAEPALASWLERVDMFSPLAGTENPRKLLEQWIGQGKPSAPMERLLNMAIFHSDMPSFLQNLLLGREADLRRAAGRAYASGAVRLMTLHGAKGMEFPVVFIAGIRQGVLPLESPRHPADREEERRLFYVGLTRAKEELLLLTSPEPSVFLADLPDSVQAQTLDRRAPVPEAEQLRLF